MLSQSRRFAARRATALLAAGLTGLALLPQAVGATVQSPVRNTAADEGSPFAGSGLVGWAQNSLTQRGSYHVFLRDAAGNVTRVNRPGTEALAGGIDGTTVVYAEWRRTFQQLVLYDVTARTYTDLPITLSAGASSHPTISGPWVLYAAGARDATTSVRAYNRLTGATRVLGSATAAGRRRFVYSGQVAGDWAAWGRVLPGAQDIFLTNLTTQKTIKLKRPHGVRFQYDPAVTATGTLFYERAKPCTRRCPQLNTAAMVTQLVEQRLGGRPRVHATLRRGQDGGYMYAAPQGDRITVLYEVFAHLRHGAISYGDIFALTLPG